MNIKTGISNYCSNAVKVNELFTQLSNAKNDIMHDGGYSSEKAQELIETKTEGFFNDIKSYCISLCDTAENIINECTSGNYEPDDTAINNAIMLVSKKNVPVEVLNAIAEKYANNFMVLKLLEAVATEENKGIFAGRMVKEEVLDKAKQSIDSLRNTTDGYSWLC